MSHVDDGTLHAYLDGQLSPAETQGVDGHLAQCASCRERLDEERALITRATELLALAAPPDRELPPFRAGDVKPVTRLWWQVRLPVAWAATVALALGIGTYLGSARMGRQVPTTRVSSEVAEQGRSRGFVAPETVPATQQAARVDERPAKRAVVPSSPKATAAPVLNGDRAGGRAAWSDAAASQPAPAPRPVAALAAAADSLSAAVAPAFTLDSARVVLGRDPVVVLGVPIRAVRHERQVGHAGVIVIEQQVDAGTVIELVERAPAAMRPDTAVVTGDREQAPAARPYADSLALQERRRVEPAAKVSARASSLERKVRPMRRIGDLDVQISGPLPADSLEKLLQLVRPAGR